MKVYCDTCVFIDALNLKKRNDKKALDELAWIFFDKVIMGEYVLVTSDHVFKEFKKVVGRDKKLKELLLKFKEKIHLIATKKDIDEARILSKSNFPDALHVVLAKRSNAIYLVTRDKHFKKFEKYLKKHSIDIKVPENL